MRKLTTADRRRRLWARHHLARPAGGPPADVADDLVALHATDPASVFLGLRARVAGLAADDVEAALYDRRTLARMLAMRRTLFVAPVSRVPTLHAAAGWSLARRERRRNLQLLEKAGVVDPEDWVDRVAEETLTALRDLGEATAVELTEVVPDLGLQIKVGKGKWAGKIGMSSRVLLWLSVVGRVSRGRPLGSWRSTMYRWAPTREWLDLELDAPPDDPAGARARLARLYLEAFGPVTFDDVHWWTGWNKTQTRKALAAVDPVEVDLEGTSGLFAPGDDPDGPELQLAEGARNGPEPARTEPGRRVVLLPPLDTTTMGWKERDWYVGDHEAALFDRNGNAGPTVWLDGRIIGGWAQRENGEIVVRLLEDAGSEVADAAECEAAALAEWLGDTRITPRFRTPLERELAS